MRKPTVLFLLLAFVGLLFSPMLVIAKPNMFVKPRYCHISIQSPQNGTHNSATILLNFTVKKWDISDVYSYFYVLDGQDYQSGVKVEEIQFVGEETMSEEHLFSYVETSLMGQAVLPSLSDGAHSVTVLIGQVIGDGRIQPANVDPFSTTAHFNVDSTINSSSPIPQETDSTPFPTILVATASGVSIVLFGLGILIYLKRHKH
jgi:hypothetical protein